MKSIKLRLFIGILFILSIFLGGMLTYGVTFKRYFQNEKLKDMKNLIWELEEKISEEGISNIDKITEKLSETYNVQIEIRNNESQQVICSTHIGGKNSMMNGKNKYETLEDLGVNRGIERNILFDKSTGVKFLASSKNLDVNDYFITVYTPINIMDEAVSKSMDLHIIIFLPITIIVFMLTAIFSNAFTRPILKIREKTFRIGKLDFEGDLNIKGKDEISNLGNDVNNLSHKIQNVLEELQTKNERLQEMIDRERKNEIIRKEFVSSISHELKSPIAVISGYAQVLEEGVISSKQDVDYYIGVINEEAIRMQVIVNDLLDLYKLESNTFTLDIKKIKFHSLVNKIIKKNSLNFHKLNINLDIQVQEAIILGDEIRIEQAIQNYINNALSHIDYRKKIKIGLKIKDEEAIFFMYNSGKHIDEVNMNKIWQGFVRIDKVRNYKENRVGLGLAIVKQILRLHSGKYGVDNKREGVEFWFSIPIVKENC